MSKKAKIVVNYHENAAALSRYQIYPSEDLAKEIEKYRKSHPARLSVSAALCILIHERLAQIAAADSIKK